MSYILEALRRAQAERERGQVPGLGAQPLPLTAPEPGAPRWPARALAALVGLALLGLLATWAVMNRPAATTQPAVATPMPPAPVFPAARVLPASAPVAALVVVSAPAPAPAPAPVPVPVPVPVAPPVSTPVPVPTNALPEVPASPDSRGAIPLAQLSPEQRRDWPVFKLGGTVWSESPASRFVIANGQLVREGEAVVPGLVLERITPKTLLLRWRGLQVVMPH